MMGPKRGLPDLHLQPSNLNSTYKHHEGNRPGTPYPRPTTGWKRSASFIGRDDAPKKEEIKKCKTTNHSLGSFPSLNSKHPPSNISPTELMRALRSILNQVDWSEVALDVVGNEKPTIYRNAFKKLIQAHIEEVVKQGGYREDGSIKQGEKEEEYIPGMEYMKCADTNIIGRDQGVHCSCRRNHRGRNTFPESRLGISPLQRVSGPAKAWSCIAPSWPRSRLPS